MNTKKVGNLRPGDQIHHNRQDWVVTSTEQFDHNWHICLHNRDGQLQMHYPLLNEDVELAHNSVAVDASSAQVRDALDVYRIAAAAATSAHRAWQSAEDPHREDPATNTLLRDWAHADHARTATLDALISAIQDTNPGIGSRQFAEALALADQPTERHPAAIEGTVIPAGVSIERTGWTIGSGAYDDARVHGVFIGTQTEVDALVAELNVRDAENIHFDDDRFWAQETTAINTADDLLNHRNAVTA